MRTAINALLAALCCLLPCFCPAGGPYAFFTPPADWLVADPALLSPRVRVGFLGKETKGFVPSLNLATEEVSVSLADYLRAVRSLHEANGTTTWREVGSLKTRAGAARLTEIDLPSDWGPLRLLQMILIRDGIAYILTGAALKEDFPQHYREFQKAFCSFTITPDPTECVASPEKRASLEAALRSLKSAMTAEFVNEGFQKEHWLPFQDSVVNDYADMGAHWQIVMLQAAQEQLLREEAR